MTDPQDLAKAYLDAWQQQWSGLAADPAWQAAAQQQWQQFMQNMMAGAPPAFAGAGLSGTVRHDEPRAAAHSPASDLGAQLLAECFMRMARLEARVADLESRAK